MKNQKQAKKELVQIIKKMYTSQSYEIVSSYFEKLCSILEDKTDHTISFFSFYNYFRYPYFVTEKIFYSIQEDKTSTSIGKEEFVSFCSKLFKGTLNEKMKILSRVLDVMKNNLIEYDSTRLILTHLLIGTDLTTVTEVENVIKIFFKEKSSMTCEEFERKTLRENPDIFFLFFYLIGTSKPFSDSSIEYFSEISPLENTLNSYIGEYDKYLLDSLPYPSDNFFNVLDCYSEEVLEELSDFEFTVSKCIKQFKAESMKKKPLSCQDFHRFINIKKPQPQEDEQMGVYQTLVGGDNNSKFFKFILTPLKKTSNKSSGFKEIEISKSYSFKNVSGNQFELVTIGNDLYIFKQKQNKDRPELKIIVPIRDLTFKVYKDNPCKLTVFSLLANTLKEFQMTFDDESSVKEVTTLIKNKTNFVTLEDEYLIDSIIGKGSYGTVAKAENLLSKETVAIKILKKDYNNSDVMACLRIEQDIATFFKKMPHSNLVEIKDVVETGKAVYIVQEYIKSGNLEHYVLHFLHGEKAKLEERKKTKECLNLISQMSEGINYYSYFGIVHRDLKPANILLSRTKSKCHLKIIDFGLARITCPSETLTDKYGSLLFLAPEMFDNKPYSNKVDVWAFGVISYFIVYGKYLFYNDDAKKVAYNIKNSSIVFPCVRKDDGETEEKIKEIIEKCLEKNSDDRPLIVGINHLIEGINSICEL